MPMICMVCQSSLQSCQTDQHRIKTENISHTLEAFRVLNIYMCIFGEECEYSILPVMSELSTVRCDRLFDLWIAGTRASSVDGELPWRSSGRAAAVASTPGSRAQAATEGGFLGLRHKTKDADGG